jgi:hypothetical protein
MDIEQLSTRLITEGIYPQILRTADGWECTLWCGVNWKGTVPRGEGNTAVAAVQAAMVDRGAILKGRSK